LRIASIVTCVAHHLGDDVARRRRAGAAGLKACRSQRPRATNSPPGSGLVSRTDRRDADTAGAEPAPGNHRRTAADADADLRARLIDATSLG
jgi:hypothetical protein